MKPEALPHPEAGAPFTTRTTTARDATQPAHLRLQFLLASVLMLAALGLGCASPWPQEHPSSLPKPVAVNRPLDARLKSDVLFKDYYIAIYSRDDEESGEILEIHKDGVRVFALEQSTVSFYDSPNELGSSLVHDSLTGEGKPHLVIQTYSGGAHCCTDVHIFELGERFRHVARFDAQHSEWVHFEDLDHNGIRTVSMADWRYIDEFDGYLSSPAPTIIFRYRDDRYQLAPDLMKQPPPPKEELDKLAREVRALFEQQQQKPEEPATSANRWNTAFPVSALWSMMINLIYTGNETEALKLFQEAWPDTFPGKQKSLKQFNALVNSSPFNPRPYWRAQAKAGK